MTSAGQVELELQERVVADDEECKEAAEIKTTRARLIMARARSQDLMSNRWVWPYHLMQWRCGFLSPAVYTNRYNSGGSKGVSKVSGN